MCNVLVVDDDKDVRDTLVGVLGDDGYVVYAAENESKTLQMLTQEQFDYAIVDLRLHGNHEDDESGISLAMTIRFLSPKTRIIMLSRFPDPKQIVKAIKYYGADDYIDKTYHAWIENVQIALQTANNESKKAELSIKKPFTDIQLHFEEKQALIVLAKGQYVSLSRSRNNLNFDLNAYAKKADIAKSSLNSLRFQTKEIGKALWNDFFENHHVLSRTYSAAAGKSDLLTLSFAGRDEYLRLPIEFLHSGDEYLTLKYPMTRFVTGVVPKRPPLSPDKLATTKKLKILLVASNTRPSIPGVDEEVFELKRNLEKIDFISLTTVNSDAATYDRFSKEIVEGKHDIIHYAGHGHYDELSPEKSGLLFWPEVKKRGTPIGMPASELKLLLERSTASLLYLSSCYGASTGDNASLLEDDFLGLSDAAVKAGVPSVIGYRWPVSDDGAKKLAIKFYESLIEQGSPRAALLNARRFVAGPNRDDPTWLSPIMIHQSL